jgi:hypothetical protein
MPRAPLDTPEDLPKEALRQVAFGQLEDEVPRMPDQAAAGLEQPLLQARQRPSLNGKGERASSDSTSAVIPVIGVWSAISVVAGSRNHRNRLASPLRWMSGLSRSGPEAIPLTPNSGN